MSSFLVAVNAVVPFLIYISFGYGVRRSGLADEAFLGRLNQLVFKAFFPILMFNNLYKIETGFTLNSKLVVFAVAGILILQAVLLLTVPRLVRENPRRGVIIQAIYRSNFVLFGIPLTASIYGAGGTTLASMMIAIVIPIYNVTAVFILELFRGGKPRPAVLLKNVCTNPLILGAAAGFAAFILGLRLPACVEKPVGQFADLTTPLALFVLGGTMHFSSIRGNARYLVPALAVKLVLLPAVIFALALALGFDSLERFVLFTMFATPIAASSYSMAENMGGDGELAGEFVVLSTAVSVITIFLWVFVLREMGLVG